MSYGVHTEPISSRLCQSNFDRKTPGLAHRMTFIFHIKIYVCKHNICVRSATESVDTIVLLEYRLVGSIRNEKVL